MIFDDLEFILVEYVEDLSSISLDEFTSEFYATKLDVPVEYISVWDRYKIDYRVITVLSISKWY